MNKVASFAYDFFISYSSEDEKLALLVHKELEKTGSNTFLSGKDLKQQAGRQWPKIIQQSLSTSQNLVLIWTENAAKSPWVEKEWALFLQNFQMQNTAGKSRGIYIFNPEEFTLPFLLSDQQYVTTINDLIASIGISQVKNFSNRPLANRKEVSSKWNWAKYSIMSIAALALIIFGVNWYLSKEKEIDYGEEAQEEVENIPIDSELAAVLNQLEANMIRVPGGTFSMGCIDTKANCHPNEFPIQQVTIKDFFINKYEVTQKEWFEITGQRSMLNAAYESYPMIAVSWVDVQIFLKRLNAMTDQHYRLPSEAEWEYAARAGGESRDHYSGSEDIATVAWYNENSNSQTQPIARLIPNDLGLYDMSGNAMEWCADFYHDDLRGYSVEGKARTSGSGKDFNFRSLRGGSWYNQPINCRVSTRGRDEATNRISNIGFRLVRSSLAVK